MKLLGLAIAAALILSSCGDKDKTKKPDPEDFGVAALNGVWKTACLKNSTDYTGPLGERKVVSIEGSEVVTQYLLYRDSNCAESGFVMTLVERSNMTFENVVSVNQKRGIQVYSVGQEIVKYGIVPANPDYADVLYRSQFCGIKKWRSGRESTVTNCTISGRILFPALTRYTLLKHDESSKPVTLANGKFENSSVNYSASNRYKFLMNEALYRN